MFWYKSCPKCLRGDLALERDVYGWYRQCVQCGYLQDLPQASAVLAPQRLEPAIVEAEIRRAA